MSAVQMEFRDCSVGSREHRDRSSPRNLVLCSLLEMEIYYRPSLEDSPSQAAPSLVPARPWRWPCLQSSRSPFAGPEPVCLPTHPLPQKWEAAPWLCI